MPMRLIRIGNIPWHTRWVGVGGRSFQKPQSCSSWHLEVFASTAANMFLLCTDVRLTVSVGERPATQSLPCLVSAASQPTLLIGEPIRIPLAEHLFGPEIMQMCNHLCTYIRNIEKSVLASYQLAQPAERTYYIGGGF